MAEAKAVAAKPRVALGGGELPTVMHHIFHNLGDSYRRMAGREAERTAGPVYRAVRSRQPAAAGHRTAPSAAPEPIAEAPPAPAAEPIPPPEQPADMPSAAEEPPVAVLPAPTLEASATPGYVEVRK